ncbi:MULTISPECIES: FadR/GntR family transcriptional regulator [unclassified Sphingomonas]|jgi:DNA-binding FadR family transcriptional regulator|uniref:FadR/GntR family transcriptional regulator n=1 Tax=unclassified Sphingomonas TaxID=196159 RepID=UPI0025CF0376|nr:MULTISPECIES: FadR/GntR family transcriptional regulator [unclassified Sphingomonas]
MKPRPEKLYQRVVNAIVEAIDQGRHGIGTRLPGERELAEEFNVSRPTIREAMIALEIRGLVEARHGSGLYVTAAPAQPPAPAELDIGAFELLEARILFEGEAAAVAATMIDDETLGALDRVLADMAACDPSGADAMAADRQFHLTIAQSTGNTVIATVVEMLWSLRERAPLSAHMFAEARREGVNPRVEEHRLIVDALRARDSAAARTAMRSHLKRVVEDLLAATEVEALRRARSEIEQQRGALERRLHA